MLLFLVLLLCTLWELYALFFNILLFIDKKKIYIYIYIYISPICNIISF